MSDYSAAVKSNIKGLGDVIRFAPEPYRQFTDFAEPANNSYSYVFMNVPKPPRLEELRYGDRRQMVMVADRSPLIDNRVSHQIDPYDTQGANSTLHESGAGQNAIYFTGVGGWYTHPTIGVEKDDIYRAGRRLRYQGTEQPVSPTDTFLVP